MRGKFIAGALLVVAVAGCGQAKVTSGTASVPTADKAAFHAAFVKCWPSSGTAQIAEVHSLVKDTKANPNGSRETLMLCFGIPKDKRTAAEGDLLTKMELVNWLSKTDRKTFEDVIFPAWYSQWRAA